jgi:hypothetical protein
MDAGWANLIITMQNGGFPSRRRHLSFIVMAYLSAMLAVLLGIGLLWL